MFGPNGDHISFENPNKKTRAGQLNTLHGYIMESLRGAGSSSRGEAARPSSPWPASMPK